MQEDDSIYDYFIIFLIAVIACGAIVHAANIHDEVVYDCRLAEISVDYPVQVKEKCRRLSHESR